MERKFVLVRRSGETRAITADQIDPIEVRERDRVLGFPTGISDRERDRLVRLASRRIVWTYKPFKKADVEVHYATTASVLMGIAYIVPALARYMALNVAFIAAILSVCTVGLVQKFAPIQSINERALLTPEKTYSSFVVHTKPEKDKPDIDIEASKKDFEEYKKWRDGVKASEK